VVAASTTPISTSTATPTASSNRTAGSARLIQLALLFLSLSVSLPLRADPRGPLTLEPPPPQPAATAPASAPSDESRVFSLLDQAARSLSAGRYRDALAGADQIESDEPNNPWLWYMRGAARAPLGEPYKAMAALDRAAALIDPDDPDAARLLELIRRQRRDARRRTLSLTLETGLAYDTNVTFFGTGASSLGAISGQADGKYLQRFLIDYAPIADANQTLAISARLAHSWHFDIEEFNYQDYGMTVQYTRRLADRLDALLRYDFDMALLGNKSFGLDHIFSPGLLYHWEPSDRAFRPLESRVNYVFESRDFLFDTDPMLDQDGFANGVAAEQSFRLRPVPNHNWACDLTFGYRYLSVPTQGEEFNRYEHQWYLGWLAPLHNPLLPDKQLLFRFQADWLLAQYRYPSEFDAGGRSRRDLIPALTFALSQKLVEDLDLGDLTLHFVIIWSDADSNVVTEDFGEPFTYDRSVFGVQLEWNW